MNWQKQPDEVLSTGWPTTQLADNNCNATVLSVAISQKAENSGCISNRTRSGYNTTNPTEICSEVTRNTNKRSGRIYESKFIERKNWLQRKEDAREQSQRYEYEF